MKLGLAGAISGAGNAMTQGLQTMNAGIVQAGVQGMQAKNDKEFQMEKLKLQQEFELSLADKKIAADYKNNQDSIAARGAEDRLTQGDALAAKEREGTAERTSRETMQKEDLSNRTSLKLMELGVHKQEHDEDNALAADRYKKQYSLEERKIAADSGKLQSIPTADGKVALMHPVTGKVKGYLTDDKGNDIKVATDISKSATEQLVALRTKMADDARIFAIEMKESKFKTPEEVSAAKQEFNASQTSLLNQIREIAKPGSVPPPAERPAKTPFVLPDQFKGMGPKAVPQSGAAPPVKKSPSVADKMAPLMGPAGLAGKFFQK